MALLGTRRRRVLLLALLAVCSSVGYQVAAVSSTAAKVLNRGGVFDWWHGPISRSTQSLGGIPADVYTGSGSHLPMLFIHGVNETGKDSPDIRPVAEAFAGSGFRVIVPDFPRLKRQSVSLSDIDDVVFVSKSLGTDFGIVCVSYGCGPALIASAMPEIRERVRFIVTFGGYFNLKETLRSIVTGPRNEWAYSKWLYMASNADLVPGDNERELLRKIGSERQEKPGDKWPIDGSCLGSEARAFLAVFESSSAEEFDMRLANAPWLRDHLDRLSPSRYISNLRARLIIVHLRQDPSIPSSQSRELAEAARTHQIPYSLTLLDTTGHTHPDWPDSNIKNFFRFYLPEGSKFLRVMREILSHS